MFLGSYRKEIKYLKPYIITAIVVICLSYSVYLFFSDDFVTVLGDEDGLFESGTAIFFVIAAVLFFLSFRRSKNIFLLGLVFVLIMGAGEEIDWGHRIFGFGTPASMEKVNVQHEFNIHNLEIFNDQDLHGVKKTGWHRLLEINILFRIFSMVFFIIIPLFFYYIKPRLITDKKIRMPVPPVTIGIFFFISWVIFFALKYYVLPRGKIMWYYLTAGEIFEFLASFIYFLTALYFYNRKDDAFLGKDIKQVLRY